MSYQKLFMNKLLLFALVQRFISTHLPVYIAIYTTVALLSCGFVATYPLRKHMIVHSHRRYFLNYIGKLYNHLMQSSLKN